MHRILIVDDHIVVRQGLAAILERSDNTSVAASIANASGAMEWLKKNDCDMAILDIAMPDMSGIDLLKQLQKSKPNLPVLIFSAYPEDQYAVRLIKSGAAGYLNKECTPEEIMYATNCVLKGKRYLSPAVVEMLTEEVHRPEVQFPHQSLSNREYQILLLIASANPPSVIAERLKLSVKTIGTYRARILQKMQVHSNIELAHYVLEHNLIYPPANPTINLHPSD